MPRSMGLRNAAELLSLNAVAMAENSAMMCSGGGSATSAVTVAASMPRNFLRGNSSAIAGIDADVTLGEIAGPKTRLPFALAANCEANLALRRVQFLLEIVFGKACGKACAADVDAHHRDIYFGGIERYTGVARRGNDAAPVGIGACARRLHQR